MSAKPEASVLLGVVGGAHGIRGECRVRSFTQAPTDLGAYGPLFDAAGNRYTVEKARAQKGVVVVQFAEVRDRDEAERLNGVELFVPRAALPASEEADEFYLDDLVGLTVETTAGARLGTVAAVHDFGAGDIVEIQPAAGGSVMIPFSEAAVPAIDLERGVMIVEPVAAGIENAGDDDDGPSAEGR